MVVQACNPSTWEGGQHGIMGKFVASLGYIVSLSPAWSTKWDLVTKKDILQLQLLSQKLGTKCIFG